MKRERVQKSKPARARPEVESLPDRSNLKAKKRKLLGDLEREAEEIDRQLES